MKGRKPLALVTRNFFFSYSLRFLTLSNNKEQQRIIVKYEDMKKFLRHKPTVTTSAERTESAAKEFIEHQNR